MKKILDYTDEQEFLDRIYPEEGGYVSDNPAEIQLISYIMMTRETEQERADSIYKGYCNAVRKALGIDKLISCSLSDDRTKVLIMVFPIAASETNFGILMIDEKGRPYMDVSLVDGPTGAEMVHVEDENVKGLVQ